jgi:hypothetical protein
MSMFQRIASFVIICISVFAISVAIAIAGPPRGPGGGGGGGGHGGGSGGFHSGGGAGGFSPGAIRSGPVGGGLSHGSYGRASAPMVRSMPSARTLPTFRSTPRSVTSHGYADKHFQSPNIRSHAYASKNFQSPNRNYQQYSRHAVTSGSRSNVHGRLGSQVANSSTVQERGVVRNHHNVVTESVRGVKNVSVIRNVALASHLSRDGKNGRRMDADLHGKLFDKDVQKTHPGKWDESFHGKFAEKNWNNNWHKDWNKKWDHPHDNWHDKWHWRHHHPIIAVGWYGPLFWPYAYWDFIDYTFWPYAYDVFWPYAYDDLYVGVFGPYAYEGPAYAESSPSSRRARRTRQDSAAAAVVCTALDALNDATKKAADSLEANCPVDQTLTPPARVAAMEKRLNAMIEAIKIVQPALQSFFGSLTDEQKARFNQLGGAQG